MKFEKELEDFINRHSIESESNSPDFILANYLKNCLSNWRLTTNARDQWHGVNFDDKKENLK